MEDTLTLVFLDDALVLDKRPYRNWRELQGAFPSYKASLGPWTVDELFDYFAADYAAGDEPFSRAEVEAFVGGKAVVLREA